MDKQVEWNAKYPQGKAIHGAWYVALYWYYTSWGSFLLIWFVYLYIVRLSTHSCSQFLLARWNCLLIFKHLLGILCFPSFFMWHTVLNTMVLNDTLNTVFQNDNSKHHDTLVISFIVQVTTEMSSQIRLMLNLKALFTRRLWRRTVLLFTPCGVTHGRCVLRMSCV